MDYYFALVIIAYVVIALCASSHCIRVGAATNDSSTFNVLDYRAIGDGEHDDTLAFSQAWTDVCNASGTSNTTLTVPEGKTFLLQPISFKGPCKSTGIHIEIQGKIVAPSEVSAWKRCEENTWLLITYVDNLTIDGHGEIDGKGSNWWGENATNEGSACHRPTALRLVHCNGLHLEGLTHKDSPGNHITISGCNNSTISDLHIIAPENSPNTDGIDISSTSYLQIYNSSMETGDDCIAIGSDTTWINITEVTCGPGHGISVGSLGMNGGQAKVEEIQVRNCTFRNSTNGARIKSWQGGSGYAKKITYEDIILEDVNNPIIIDQYYCPEHNCTTQPSAVEFSDLQFGGFRGTSTSDAAITLNCSQAIPCSNVVLDNINIIASIPGKNVSSVCVNVQGQENSVLPLVPCLQKS